MSNSTSGKSIEPERKTDISLKTKEITCPVVWTTINLGTFGSTSWQNNPGAKLTGNEKTRSNSKISVEAKFEVDLS